MIPMCAVGVFLVTGLASGYVITWAMRQVIRSRREARSC